MSTATSSAPFGIRSFAIYGLFGTSDVVIPFDEPVKILIGENGLGKTQVLNMLYYVLEGQLDQLSTFEFERLEAILSDGEGFVLTKQDADYWASWPAKLRELMRKLGLRKFFELLGKAQQSHTGNFLEAISGGQVPLVPQIEYTDFERKDVEAILNLTRMGTFNGLESLPDPFKAYVHCIENRSILYFPTYRRIEQELNQLGLEEEHMPPHDTRLIQFGMEDVEARFRQFELEIDQLLKEGFPKISGEMLSQLVNGAERIDLSWVNEIDKESLDILLARVGDQLEEKDKTEIRRIIVEKRLDNPMLLAFIQRLFKLYDQQSQLDQQIRAFRDVCNRYLVNKEIYYDESRIKVYPRFSNNQQPIKLRHLSLGEKQIISILSKVYLAPQDERFLILFDEPELSLSMKWQQQLLPDILNSGKCDFLMAVTHSPFIFDNELDPYAVGLNEYITPSQQVPA